MSSVRLEDYEDRRPRAPLARVDFTVRDLPRERLSDCWPDFASARSQAELTQVARKNKLGAVATECACAVLYSVGLVVALMALLDLLHAG